MYYGTKLGMDYMDKTEGGYGGVIVNVASMAGSVILDYHASLSQYNLHLNLMTVADPSFVLTLNYSLVCMASN